MQSLILTLAQTAGTSAAEQSASWQVLVVLVLCAILLVIVNGFFVAAEFSLVKVRGSQIEELVRRNRPFSMTARWLVERLEGALSACQLGITMASLGLGWVGEPAFAKLLEPLLRLMQITSAAAIHTIAFIFAFTLITGLHLVIGEQAPKIFAIRRPEQMVLWCALPLKLFYVLSYPLLVSLNGATGIILRWVGLHEVSGHETPHSEEEIRALLREAHIHGDLSRSEHHLIDAVFEFDDMICRLVMVPRADVSFLRTDMSLSDCLEQFRRERHTRFPLCEDSLDNIVGVVHVKDFVGLDLGSKIELRSLARPPKQVPENMHISRLLRHFQATRQHLAFVVDEYGTTIGIVTMENVIEQIVGTVQDEFDQETPDVVPDGPGQYVVRGGAPLNVIRMKLGIELPDTDADTISGYLMEELGEILKAGVQIALPNGATADVLDVRHSVAERVRITMSPQEATASDQNNT